MRHWKGPLAATIHEPILSQVQLSAMIAAEQFKDQHYYNILFELVPELASHKPEALRSHL